jgi:hypothetical protein
MILTRSLLSVVARAEYVDHPTDTAERARFWQYRARDVRDRIAHLQGLQELRFPVEVDELRRFG